MIRRIATAIAFTVGIFMMVQYFIQADAVHSLYVALRDYYQIIFAMTMVVGGLTLLRHHAGKVAEKRSGAFYSAVTVAAVLFMVVSAAVAGTRVGSPYQWAFNNLQAPMQATTFSLLAFFVASAAYRGFRLRSKPAIVLAAAVILVLIGRNAFGDMIGSWLPQAAGWLLNNPSVAAKRGILVGIGLGSTATAMRVILGIERTYL